MINWAAQIWQLRGLGFLLAGDLCECRKGFGLKLAVVAGVPVRVADAVMDRLAVPVHGQDVHAPFLLPAADRTPGRPGQRRRFQPRNMAFTDGLDYWELAGNFLVRLARDGDPAAFRLLVERHLPMARARAARLCPQPGDADDAVQDAFLQAFLALDRLRDPSRFAGWLGGIREGEPGPFGTKE